MERFFKNCRLCFLKPFIWIIKNEVTSIVTKFATVQKEVVNNFENVVFIWNSSVAKTHLATAIGISTAKKRISTYFIKFSNLIAQLNKANKKGVLNALL